MEYQVFCDNYLLLDTRLEEYKLYNPKVSKTLNKVGTFTFSIYPDHKHFLSLTKMKSTITVYQNSNLIFRGRILDFEQGFYNEKQVTCEGELAFLIDSIQRPYTFTGSIRDFLVMLIENHNSQVTSDRQFYVGNVTLTDNNNSITRSDSQYSTTWDLINSGLLETIGGYIVTRHEEDGVYIDYLNEDDFNLLNNQGISFGKNLLSVVKTAQGADIATIIVPLGATVDDTVITIQDLPDDTTSPVQKIDDYIFNQEEINKYGKITKTISFNDVTEAQNLLTKAREYYGSQLKNDKVTITLNAADMASINDDLNEFKLGTKIYVKSDYHALDDYYLINSLDIELLKPSNNKLVLGKSYNTFTEASASSGKAVESVGKTVSSTKEIINVQVAEIYKQLETSVDLSSSEIYQQVAENYYSKDETNSLVQSLNTEFTQTKDEFNFQFNNFSQYLNELQNGNEAQFQNISKYIRFVDGNIILGEEGNELTLKIENDRIAFLQNNVEVAYFSNRKLYVLDGQFLNTLRIGNFSFLPRANGNVSWKKVI